MGQIFTRHRQDHARHSRRATAIASFGREPREAVRDQREDRPEVAASAVGGRHADGAEGETQHCSLTDGRSSYRRTAGAGAAAAG